MNRKKERIIWYIICPIILAIILKALWLIPGAILEQKILELYKSGSLRVVLYWVVKILLNPFSKVTYIFIILIFYTYFIRKQNQINKIYKEKKPEEESEVQLYKSKLSDIALSLKDYFDESDTHSFSCLLRLSHLKEDKLKMSLINEWFIFLNSHFLESNNLPNLCFEFTRVLQNLEFSFHKVVKDKGLDKKTKEKYEQLKGEFDVIVAKLNVLFKEIYRKGLIDHPYSLNILPTFKEQ